MSKLTFQELRDANVKRLSVSAYQKCEDDWTTSDWMMAMVGEVGEAANMLKKVRRGDVTLEKAREGIAKELADIQCYLDILAFKLDIDLGAATVAKFNEVSKRVRSDVRLPTGAQLIPVTFCHGIEDAWWVADLPGGDYVNMDHILGMEAMVLQELSKFSDVKEVELVWSKKNSPAMLRYKPDGMRCE